MGVFSHVVERLQGLQGDQARAPMATLNDLLLAASKAMDLLEGKPMRSGMKVAVLAGSIARLMGLPLRETHSVVYAALLHDLGLAGLVADIYPHLPPGMTDKSLFQTHALLNARVIGTPHERNLSADLAHLLQQHPLNAASLVQQFNLSDDVREMIAAHHELCDGTGYPFGLSREQIPIGARILAFADVTEAVLAMPNKDMGALTTRRAALDNFLDIKTQGRFDPDVVAVFQGLLDTHEDFLTRLNTLEVEEMVRQLLPERQEPVSGELMLAVVQALGSLSDDLMPLYKAERSQRMARLAVRLAESLGIGREQCGELAISALLMDIGHLATPIGLLLKRGTLSADERALIQDHALLTQDVLKGLPGFENIVLWAGEHHERMNGKGYPGQKKGYEISVGGRLLALVDVFDALTHPRPYRNHSHDPMDALPVIGQGRMTLYDNQLVSQLRRIVLETELVVR